MRAASFARKACVKLVRMGAPGISRTGMPPASKHLMATTVEHRRAPAERQGVPAAIETRDLTRVFDGVRAVDRVCDAGALNGQDSLRRGAIACVAGGAGDQDLAVGTRLCCEVVLRDLRPRLLGDGLHAT